MKTLPLAAILILACVSSTLAAGVSNPFFAMDTMANRGSEPLAEKLDDLKAMGYTGLSWTGTAVPQIASLIRECDARGLKVYSLYVGFNLEKDKLQAPDNIDAVFEAVGKHGTVVWVYILSKQYKPSDRTGDAVAVPALQDLSARAAKHGVKLALYPHAGFWAQSFGDCLTLAEKVDRANFGVSFNLCHVLKTGDEANIASLLRRAKPRLFIVSLNGADAGGGPKAGWDRLIQPVGRGTFDLVAMLRELKSIGYDGPIGFQGYGIQGDRKAILRETMEGWKKVSAGAGK